MGRDGCDTGPSAGSGGGGCQESRGVDGSVCVSACQVAAWAARGFGPGEGDTPPLTKLATPNCWNAVGIGTMESNDGGWARIP
jgi:hypothetical protein